MARSRKDESPPGAAGEPLPEEWEATPEPGWVAPALEEEFPGLSVRTTLVGRGSGRSPAPIREQLRRLSDRFYGAHAINMRQQTIPYAYRVFFRHIGLDPDATKTPVEEVAMQRLRQGRFKSQNLLDDALTIATAEVGVAMLAFDADQVQGRLGIRGAAPGERLEGRATPLEKGTLVLADEERPLAVLFGQMGEGRGVRAATKRTLLVAIGVRGVPEIALEEALWVAASAMRSGG